MLPIQCRAARTLLGWGVRDLAKKAKLSFPTVVRFEGGDASVTEATKAKIHAALEKGGVIFIDENGAGLGVRLRKRGKR